LSTEGRLGSGKLRSGKLRSGKLRSGKLRSGKLRSGKLKAGQLKSGQLRTGQLRTGQLRTGQQNPALGYGGSLSARQGNAVQRAILLGCALEQSFLEAVFRERGDGGLHY